MTASNALSEFLKYQRRIAISSLELAREDGGSEQDAAEFDLKLIQEAIADFERMTGKPLAD